jgi:hypothetical protein
MGWNCERAEELLKDADNWTMMNSYNPKTCLCLQILLVLFSMEMG